MPYRCFEHFVIGILIRDEAVFKVGCSNAVQIPAVASLHGSPSSPPEG